MTVTATPLPTRRRGVGHFLHGYRSMVRFERTNLRTLLAMTLVLQILMGAGAGIMYGFYLGDLPGTAKVFLVSGIPALALFPVGFIIVPFVVAIHRIEETHDYVWSMPVPRFASAAATFTVFSLVVLPGAVVAVLVSTLAYGVSLSPSLMLIPAVALTSAMCTSVGYALGHGVKNPEVANLISNTVVFAVLMFSPIVVPIEFFPEWFAAFHRVMPFWHMANVLRAGLTDGLVSDVATSYAVLALWMAAAWAIAGRIITRRG